MPDWTTPHDISDKVLGLWNKGKILGAKITGEPLFPLSLSLRRPDTRSYSERFEEVRTWIRSLEDGARERRGFGYDIEWAEINHRQLGRNKVPDKVAVPTEADALKLIGKQKDAERFERLFRSTHERFPQLRDWLVRKPFVALANVKDWTNILAVLAWFRDHPNSGLYLRQIDIAGIDTKFIENHKSLLADLLSIAIEKKANFEPDPSLTFEQCHGLKSKPPIVRFRLLDPALAIGGLTDIAAPADQFAALRLPARRIFITENEINGLAFPAMANSVVVFGLGYSLDLLGAATWMQDCEIHYWGDIDTHGFAMLNRLRTRFPLVRSFLMDRDTLLSHRALWVQEDKPFRGTLAHLAPDERALFETLASNQFGERVRLEQERIPFGRLQEALEKISPTP